VFYVRVVDIGYARLDNVPRGLHKLVERHRLGLRLDARDESANLR
jgi:hypothetical protein